MKKIFSFSLFFLVVSTAMPTLASKLDDFSKIIDKAMEAGLQCESDLSMQGKTGLTQNACKNFSLRVRMLGDSRTAMQKNLENIINGMDESNCDDACLAAMTNASIGLIQLIYILDYIDFVKGE